MILFWCQNNANTILSVLLGHLPILRMRGIFLSNLDERAI
jgi:hypothetical protein